MSFRRRKNVKVPRVRVAVSPPSVGLSKNLEAMERAVIEVARAASDGAAGYLGQAGVPIDFDLEIGDNLLEHGLGRTPLGVLAIPYDAGAAMPGYDPVQAGNPQPTRLAVVKSVTSGRYRLIFF